MKPTFINGNYGVWQSTFFVKCFNRQSVTGRGGWYTGDESTVMAMTAQLPSPCQDARMSDGVLILVAGLLLAAGIAASLLAGRVRLPALVLFLGVGMAIGSDGTGWIDFDDYELARRIGIIALALILFEGGLAVRWGELRAIARPAILLASFGTIVTAAITGVGAYWLFDFSLLEALLIGAILSATDGAAIFALLRGSRLRRRVARTLEGEAGLNDPMAVLLVIGFVTWIDEPGYGFGDMVLLFVRQLGIGLVVGFGIGLLAVVAFRRLASEPPGCTR